MRCTVAPHDAQQGQTQEAGPLALPHRGKGTSLFLLKYTSLSVPTLIPLLTQWEADPRRDLMSSALSAGL